MWHAIFFFKSRTRTRQGRVYENIQFWKCLSFLYKKEITSCLMCLINIASILILYNQCLTYYCANKCRGVSISNIDTLVKLKCPCFLVWDVSKYNVSSLWTTHICVLLLFILLMASFLRHASNVFSCPVNQMLYLFFNTQSSP